MEEKHKALNYTIHESSAELSDEDQQLIDKAKAQLDYAYAPYSRFHVGAAIRLSDGQIFTGSNQENASFPLCICAERVALYAMSAKIQAFRIDAIAITAKNMKKEHKGFCMPCGACRQVIQEYEQRQDYPMRLLLTGDAGKVMEIQGIDSILPMSFSIKDLL